MQPMRRLTLGHLIVAIAATAGLSRAALAADCAPPLPTDKDVDSPGTDACPAILPKLTCGETFYVRQDGPGTAPTTIQGALSPKQFNDSARWHEGAGKDGKIGAGDCVQIVGNVTGPLIVQASGAPNSPISILGVDDATYGKTQLVGSVAFKSTDYVWFKGTERGAVWFTDGSRRKQGCEPGKPGGCAHPGIAASLGLDNCRVLWIGDHVARLREPADFRWGEARENKGDRLILLNAALTSDPNVEALQLRCAAHTGERVDRNSCGAASGQERYFCEGTDFPPENFALYVGNHSYVDIRSLRINYADFGIGMYGDLGARNHDNGHNSARCVTIKEVDKAGVLIERQSLGHEEVSDSGFYGTGDGIYTFHPDGGEGHAFCRNYFVGINQNARNNADGHAIGLQETRDTSVEWNYIEKARKPIGLWAWREDPRGFTTNNVRIRYNHIVGAVAPQTGKRNPGDGAGIVLISGDSVYGNEIAYNLIERDPAGGPESLLTGIWAGGSGSAKRAPNRFLNNTIVGAQTSFVLSNDNVLSEFRNNISYKPTGMHVRVQGKPDAALPHFEHNLYYPVEGEHAFQLRGGKKGDFEQWRSVAGETGSLVADPEFENDAGRDYRLRESSPVKRAGIGVEASPDGNGTPDSKPPP